MTFSYHAEYDTSGPHGNGGQSLGDDETAESLDTLVRMIEIRFDREEVSCDLNLREIISAKLRNGTSSNHLETVPPVYLIVRQTD